MSTQDHLTTASRSNVVDDELRKGRVVKLCGLKKAPHLNGRIGIVASDKKENGRFEIQLEGVYTSPTTGIETRDKLSLKEENLERCFKTQSCNGCLKTFDPKNLNKCSKCKLVRYCSKECQRLDWKRNHKEDCSILLATRKSMKNAGSQEDENALPEKPGDRVYFLMQRGARFTQKGDHVSAERDFRRLVETEGFRTLGSYVNLAASLLGQKRVQEAIPYLERAITIPPLEGEQEVLIAYQMLGQAHEMAGNKAAAAAAYRKGLALFPGDAQMKTMLERTTTSE